MLEETNSRYGTQGLSTVGVPVGKKEDISGAIDILFSEISLLQGSITELQKTTSPFCRPEEFNDSSKLNEKPRIPGSLVRNRIQDATDIVNIIRQDVLMILRSLEV